MNLLQAKYYPSCDLLPLWNFFKVSSGTAMDLKYLMVAPSKLYYQSVVLTGKEVVELTGVWDKVFEEYNNLEKNFGVTNFLNDRSKMLYFYALYLQEHALIKSLLYRTDAQYIRLLRARGYQLRNTSNADYWEDLSNSLKQVENHMTQIEMLRNKVEQVDGESEKDGNPFDSIMAWIASNDIKVDEDITVARYIKVKEIIQARIKAKKRNAVAA